MAGEFQITYERQDDEMIAIIDYDAGNIKSVEKAMQLLGQEVTITRDRETIMNADKVMSRSIRRCDGKTQTVWT